MRFLLFLYELGYMFMNHFVGVVFFGMYRLLERIESLTQLAVHCFCLKS